MKDMTLFNRAILFGVSLLLIIISFPYLMFKDSLVGINQTQIIFNIIFGSFIAIYNFLIIYKRATTVHVIVDSESIKQKIKEKKGEDKYD